MRFSISGSLGEPVRAISTMNSRRSHRCSSSAAKLGRLVETSMMASRCLDRLVQRLGPSTLGWKPLGLDLQPIAHASDHAERLIAAILAKRHTDS